MIRNSKKTGFNSNLTKNSEVYMKSSPRKTFQKNENEKSYKIQVYRTR